MADELDALLARVDDEALRSDLTAQIARLRQKRRFGLVFEEHLPERSPLQSGPVGEEFVRIESIAKASDGSLRSLDLMDESVRAALADFSGAEVGALYESDVSMPYK